MYTKCVHIWYWKTIIHALLLYIDKRELFGYTFILIVWPSSLFDICSYSYNFEIPHFMFSISRSYLSADNFIHYRNVTLTLRRLKSPATRAFFKCLFWPTTKDILKLRITDENPLVVGWFPSQRINNAGHVVIAWRLHVHLKYKGQLKTFFNILDLSKPCSSVSTFPRSIAGNVSNWRCLC